MKELHILIYSCNIQRNIITDSLKKKSSLHIAFSLVWITKNWLKKAQNQVHNKITEYQNIPWNNINLEINMNYFLLLFYLIVCYLDQICSN